MNKALCISAAMAMALSGAALAKDGTNSKWYGAGQPTGKDCELLTVAPARTNCMRSALRSDTGLDTVNRATGSGTLWQGPGQPKAAASSDTPPRANIASDAPAVGGTPGAGAKAEGHMNLQSDVEITH